MLSNKWTFSLTFLVMMLAFGLVLTPALADDPTFGATFTPGELMDDVSTVDHADITDIQVESTRNRTSVYPTDVPNADIIWYTFGGQPVASNSDFAPPASGDPVGPVLSFSVDFDRVVELYDVTQDTVVSAGGLYDSKTALGLDDFTIDAYDDLFRALGTLSLSLRWDISANTNAGGWSAAGAPAAGDIPIANLKFKTPRLTQVLDPGELPGRQFTLTINNHALQNAYNAATGGAFEIHHLLLTLKHGAATDASIEALTKFRRLSPADQAKADNKLAHSNGPHFIRVDLVEKDEGDPKYDKIQSGTLTAAVEGDPGVVAITKVVDRSLVSTVETGPFDIRIMLTEEPKEFTAAHIRVKNGSASEPVHLLPIPSPGTSATGDANETDADGDFATIAREMGLNYYAPGTNAATTDYPAFIQISDDANANNAGAVDYTSNPQVLPVNNPGDSFPRATGRDNAYHLYSVTITPNADINGFVTISVNDFEDQVLPISNRFDALTDAELVADKPQLDDEIEAERSRRAWNGREVLEVRVQTAAAVDIFKPTADHLGATPRLKALPEKAVVPANGYLVLTSGDAAQSGVQGSPAKPADKKTAASKLYNVTNGFELPFPANDLSNFFRNGGTLQLLHVDIPESTAGADGDKGYAGATTGAAAAGSLRISEIMWGLDANLLADARKSQYIEIQNTTAADIGIDKNEWVIAVGSGADTVYTTVVDTVGNSAGWAVPGSDGNTAASAANPTVIDLISMNRVGDDGTAQASWIASERPSANLSGRRVGTPGAANNPSTAPPVEVVEEVVVTTPAAPAAEADDIMISEVMVASNGGRLPQWIELANVSGAAVSLSGWSLVVENDTADNDVIGNEVEIDLGDTEIGEDQVALVVTKEGRNSGVGTGEGDLRADRIINVRTTVSPDNARYSLISEMGFMITLVPPQTGAVRTYGDSGGNLNMGWDVPMSETGRSSLIRREMGDAGEIMGTDAAGWVLASGTNRDGAYRTTYYGSDEDVGTPGYNAGGALPVELSMFSAKRDALTGQVVITWETQSELNNAGFFIKRSQQKDSKFVVVNAVMVPGAGTTAEKQSYTYTDSSASPNIVYYYQIEDVSLDGNRQTLTRAHRLKGHIGAAGKLTTIWGELKEQE